MAEERRYYDLIRFVAYDEGDTAATLMLKVDSEWTLEPGVKPNLFPAVVPYTEFEKLKGELAGRRGKLEFLYHDSPLNPEGKPDLTLEQIRLVDVEPGRYAPVPPSRTPRFVEYRLAFADRRDDFDGDFGGALEQGYLNKEPLTSDETRDADGRRSVTNKELVDMCLEAMEVKDITDVPHELADLPRVMNINWRGNRAAEELEKILRDLGYVLSLTNDAKFRIERIGDGFVPEGPAERIMLDASYPGLDRRGEAVIFTSHPAPVLNTATYTGPSDDLQFVILDTDDRWKPLAQASYFAQHSPEDVIRKDFAQITERYRVRVSRLLYAAVRLNPDRHGPAPFIRQRLDTGTSTQLEVNVRAKALLISGGFHRPADLDIAVTHLADSGRVAVLGQRIGGLRDNFTQSVTPNADFKAPAAGDVQPTATREVWEKKPDGNWQPRYPRFGFKQELGQIVKLTDAQMTAMINQKKAGTVYRPELRLIQKDGVDVNREKLELKAKMLAQTYVGGSGTPARLVSIAGFYPVRPSGSITQVKIRQTPPSMTWKVNTWHRPHDTTLERDKKRRARRSGGGTFPKAQETLEQRTAQGASSAAQPVVPLQPAGLPTFPTPGLIYVQLNKRSGEGGSKVTLATWKYDVALLGGQVILSDVAPTVPRRPGSFTEATHGLAYLDTTASPVVWKLLIAFEQQQLTDWIEYANLTQTGGANGSVSTRATWSYDVTLLNGVKILENASQLAPREIGRQSAGTQGLVIWNPTLGVWQLLFAFEENGVTPCP